MHGLPHSFLHMLVCSDMCVCVCVQFCSGLFLTMHTSLTDFLRMTEISGNMRENVFCLLIVQML